MNENQTEKPKKKRARSPGYPGIDLQVAIELARKLRAQEGQHPTPVNVVLSHWGYQGLTGPGAVALAALKKFGLLDDEGTGQDRRVKVSELALSILLDSRAESPERDEAIKRAALNPTIHRKLWEQFHGELPSDDNLSFQLLRNERFTDRAVEEFIPQFRRTIAFAKLESSDTVSGHEEDKPSFKEERTMSPMPDIRRPEPPSSPVFEQTSPEVIEQKIEVGLVDGQITYYRAPSTMKQADWDKIRSLLDVLAPKKEKAGSVTKEDDHK